MEKQRFLRKIGGRVEFKKIVKLKIGKGPGRKKEKKKRKMKGKWTLKEKGEKKAIKKERKISENMKFLLTTNN